MVKKYRKKPIVIEAIQYRFTGATNNNCLDVSKFIGTPGVLIHSSEDPTCIIIKTLEGDHTASPNDFIIKGIKNEFYPCKPDIFEATYEEVENEQDQNN